MSTDPSNGDRLGALSPLAHEVAEVIARVASDVALVIDQEGVIRSVSEGSASLPPDCNGWVGRRWVDTVSVDTRRKIEMLLDELRTTAVTQRREVNHPLLDGDDVPMSWTAVRLGEQGLVVAVGRDLRAVAAIQRRFLDAQHEMELDYWQRRHADNRFRALFDVASDAVVVVDAAALGVMEFNDAARQLFGAAEGSATGRPLAMLLHEGVRSAMVELLVNARGSGRAGEMRLRLLGDSRAWDVSATPFKAADRKQLLVRARLHVDEAESTGSTTMMRQLVQSTPDGVVVTDSVGHILLANPAFIALVQRGSEAHVLGHPLTDVVGDASGAWANTIAATRLRGLCPRNLLSVGNDSLPVSVEVCSTLLAEGDQEHLGFTLRIVGGAAAVQNDVPDDGWTELGAVRAQLGVTGLDSLLREGTAIIERRLILSALELAQGKLDMAARMLQLDQASLQSRMHRLELPSGHGNGNGNGSGNGNGHGGNGGGHGGSSPPRRFDA